MVRVASAVLVSVSQVEYRVVPWLRMRLPVRDAAVGAQRWVSCRAGTGSGSSPSSAQQRPTPTEPTFLPAFFVTAHDDSCRRRRLDARRRRTGRRSRRHLTCSTPSFQYGVTGRRARRAGRRSSAWRSGTVLAAGLRRLLRRRVRARRRCPSKSASIESLGRGPTGGSGAVLLAGRARSRWRSPRTTTTAPAATRETVRRRLARACVRTAIEVHLWRREPIGDAGGPRRVSRSSRRHGVTSSAGRRRRYDGFAQQLRQPTRGRVRVALHRARRHGQRGRS